MNNLVELRERLIAMRDADDVELQRASASWMAALGAALQLKSLPEDHPRRARRLEQVRTFTLEGDAHYRAYLELNASTP